MGPISVKNELFIKSIDKRIEIKVPIRGFSANQPFTMDSRMWFYIKSSDSVSIINIEENSESYIGRKLRIQTSQK